MEAGCPASRNALWSVIVTRTPSRSTLAVTGSPRTGSGGIGVGTGAQTTGTGVGVAIGDLGDVGDAATDGEAGPIEGPGLVDGAGSATHATPAKPAMTSATGRHRMTPERRPSGRSRYASTWRPRNPAAGANATPEVTRRSRSRGSPS